MIDGGATDGNCATGSCVMATLPATTMNSAMTHAKMGRLMKNCAIAGAQRDAADAAGATAACGRGRCTGRPRHRLDDDVGPQLLEAVDHHLLAGLQPVQHHPLTAARGPQLHRAAAGLAIGHHQHRGALLRLCHRLLRQHDGRRQFHLFQPHAHEQPGQQRALGVGHFSAQRDLRRAGVDRQVGEQQPPGSG
jgi:hypothetical protein